MGGESAQVDTGKHPGMHTTKTVDVVVVMSGRVRLILEDGEAVLGPGDVVIQRGTNHAWEAVGDELAVCLGVLVDRDLA
ncbi:MAG: cupin domain-containing protein [Nocardioidaceae bacterium]